MRGAGVHYSGRRQVREPGVYKASSEAVDGSKLSPGRQAAGKVSRWSKVK